MNNEKINKNLQLIYAIWVGNYVYLGSGKHERLYGNCSKLRRERHHNKLLQGAYKEIQEVKTEVLEFNIEDESKARELENYYIEYYKKIDGIIVCNVRSANNGCTSKAYNKYKRLTEDKVREIKRLLDEYSNTKLAEMFNCSDKAISDIRRGIHWVNV